MQTVKNNKQDCAVVADRTVQLVMALVETTRGLTVADLDPSLRADMERLSVDLREIRDIMVEQANRSTFARVLNHLGDVDNISRCKEKLDHSFRTFQVYSTMAIRIQMARLEANSLNRPLVTPILHRSVGCALNLGPASCYSQLPVFSFHCLRSHSSLHP